MWGLPGFIFPAYLNHSGPKNRQNRILARSCFLQELREREGRGISMTFVTFIFRLHWW
jgi:hypothetical protein